MDRIEPKLVTIFGGSGFVGTQIVQLLAKRGHPKDANAEVLGQVR